MTGRQTFILRAATPEDVPDVLRLIRGLAEYEHMLPQVSATEADLHGALFADPPRLHAVLAEIDRRSVGLALFYYTFNTFSARPNIFLEDLFVEPAHRGAGIGLALMCDLARRAVAENCRRIEWRVLNWNQPSIDFYERLGATQVLDWQTRTLSGGALTALARGTTHG